MPHVGAERYSHNGKMTVCTLAAGMVSMLLLERQAHL